MSKPKIIETPELPSRGGSYVRDPKTGKIARAEPAPAPDPRAPVKPIKKGAET